MLLALAALISRLPFFGLPSKSPIWSVEVSFAQRIPYRPMEQTAGADGAEGAYVANAHSAALRSTQAETVASASSLLIYDFKPKTAGEGKKLGTLQFGL